MPNITLYLPDDVYTEFLQLDKNLKNHVRGILKTILISEMRSKNKMTGEKENGKEIQLVKSTTKNIL